VLRRPAWRSGWLVVAAVVAATTALVAWFYLLDVHANGPVVNSDGATVMLEAASLLHGNLLLHGWWLSLDSWWTLDATIFAVVIGVTGTHPALLLVVPAIVAGLVVLTGVRLARRGLEGAAAWAGAALVVAVPALPAHALASQFLVGPWHQTTILVALAAFVALRRGRFGPGWVAAVVLLTAGMLGDLMMVAYATAPIALGGLVAMLRRRSLRAGLAPLAAGAALLVDLRSQREWVEALTRLAMEPGLRSHLGRLGLARASRYTWERSVEDHCLLLADELARGRRDQFR